MRRGPRHSAELHVRLTPRARRDLLTEQPGGTWAAAVTAPPVDGRANDALCRLVAARAGVPPSAVRVVRGQRGREKTLAVDGVAQAELDARLRAR